MMTIDTKSVMFSRDETRPEKLGRVEVRTAGKKVGEHIMFEEVQVSQI